MHYGFPYILGLLSLFMIFISSCIGSWTNQNNEYRENDSKWALTFFVINTTFVHIQMMTIRVFHLLECNGHVIKISCMAKYCL